jgi:Recombination endonuclease VII
VSYNAAYQRAYRKAHQDEIRAYRLAYRKAHLEELRAADRAYGKANREERRAYESAWRAVNRERVRALSTAWRKAHPDKVAAINRRRLYGPDADFDAILAAQNGRCAGGCDRVPTCLDHDHETRAVRGALCIPCNTDDVLGPNYRTDPDLTPQEISQFHDLVSRVLEAGSVKKMLDHAYYLNRKALALAAKVAQLGVLDARWAFR